MTQKIFNKKNDDRKKSLTNAIITKHITISSTKDYFYSN